MIKRLAHVCIHTTNLTKTEHFYCQALGLKKQFEFVRNDKPFGFYLRLGNHSFIEVFAGDPGEVGNINHLALEVTSIDEIAQTLKAHGYEISEKKMGGDHSWQAWTADPSGIRIELHEYTAQSMQLTGGVCHVDW